MKNNEMTFGCTFDSTSPNWSPTPEYNTLFLRAQQSYLNDRLMRTPFLTVNDVFEALGFDRTLQGMVYGWDQDGVINFVTNPQEDGSIVVSFTATNIYEEMKGN